MRLIRSLSNWLVMLTSPLWVLPVFLSVSLMALISPQKHPDQYRVVTGKNWMF
jgi:hypothetical protein